MSPLSFSGALRSALAAVAVASLMVAASGCDTTDDTALNVFVVDFDFSSRDYVADSQDLYTATYDAVNARVRRGDLTDALRTAGDGALVMLYIDIELVSDAGSAENGTWAALPLTRGFDQLVFGDTDGDGTTDGDVLVTGLLAHYEYSFDNGDLYFDVRSSLPYTDFVDESNPAAFFDTIKPKRFEGESQDINLRLVTIPNELYFTDAQAGARVDLRDYQAVKAAYGLPD